MYTKCVFHFLYTLCLWAWLVTFPHSLYADPDPVLDPDMDPEVHTKKYIESFLIFISLWTNFNDWQWSVILLRGKNQEIPKNWFFLEDVFSYFLAKICKHFSWMVSYTFCNIRGQFLTPGSGSSVSVFWMRIRIRQLNEYGSFLAPDPDPPLCLWASKTNTHLTQKQNILKINSVAYCGDLLHCTVALKLKHIARSYRSPKMKKILETRHKQNAWSFTVKKKGQVGRRSGVIPHIHIIRSFLWQCLINVPAFSNIKGDLTSFAHMIYSTE